MRSLAPLPSRQVGLTALPRLGHGLLPKGLIRAGSGNVRGESAEESSGMFSADPRRRVWQNGAEVDNQSSMVWLPGAPTGAQSPLMDGDLLGLDDPSAMSPHERPYFRYPGVAAREATPTADGSTAAATKSAAAGVDNGSLAITPFRESSPTDVSQSPHHAHFAIRQAPVAKSAPPPADAPRYNPDALRFLHETFALQPTQTALEPIKTASLAASPAPSSLTPLKQSRPDLTPASGSAEQPKEGGGKPRGLLQPSSGSFQGLQLTWSWEEWILGLGIGAAAIGVAVTILGTASRATSFGAGHGMSSVVAPAGKDFSGSAASGSALSEDLLARGAEAAAGRAADAAGVTVKGGVPLKEGLPSLPVPVIVLGEEQAMAAGETGKGVPFYLREARPGVIELSAATLPHVLRLRPTFVMFYAPWCPYCQRMEAAWAALAEKLHQESFNVQVARVDAYRYPELTDKYKIPGFPTLMLFNGETPIATHRGRRNLDALFSFVEKHF